MSQGRLVSLTDTNLFLEERGQQGAFPILVLHGGPGRDHHMFGDYLDPIADDGRYRLVLVDQRGQGRSDRSVEPKTLTIEQMAADVSALADSLSLSAYGVFGHSFGAFVALQHAVDYPGAATASIISAGVASSRWLAQVEQQLARFEPVELRELVTASWAREQSAQTQEDVASIMADQCPFHFADPRDPRIADFLTRTSQACYAPAVLRYFSTQDYGGIQVEGKLGRVPQPVLVLSGRYDRTCPPEAGAEMAEGLPRAEHVVFEHSAHMFYVEEQDRFLGTVLEFLNRAVDQD